MKKFFIIFAILFFAIVMPVYSATTKIKSSLGTTKINSSQSITNGGLDKGLIGLWSFDGKDTTWTSATAGTVADKSGNGNTGTLTNMNRATSPVAGKIGQALKFNGSTGYISSGDINSVDSATQLTFSAWIKITDNSRDNDIFAKGLHGTNEPVLFWRDDVVGGGSQNGNTNAMSVLISDADTMAWTASPTNSLNDLNWHHVLFTFTADILAGLKIYVDGVNVNNASTVGVDSIKSTTNLVTIGSATGGGPTNIFGGLIDDVRIYNRALSASEVKQLYQLGSVKVH